jgi:aryl-alcohol dehydrogenase-like predicted oxidoreductase
MKMLEIAQLSKIGFGAYRVSVDDQENYIALAHALKHGCNLIDTSSNYRNGKSELLIGKVLRELEVPAFVITKGGYIQNDNLKVLEELNARGLATDDIVSIRPDFKHSIHQDFLQIQIQRSQQRLQRKVLDVFMLHTPEHYFSQVDRPTSRAEYYARIRKAFTFLEDKVDDGTIRYYGVSSNTFPVNADDPKSTSLDELLKIAAEVSANHHFRFIQFPYNLAENQAATIPHATVPLLPFAKANNIITVINRPLNATHGKEFLRLASYDNLQELNPEKDKVLFNNFADKLRHQLKALDEESDILDFEIIKHLDLHWMSIGNQEAVTELYHVHLYPFLNQLYAEEIPEDIRRDFHSLISKSAAYSRKIMSEKAKVFIHNMISAGKLQDRPGLTLSAMVCQQYLDDGVDHVLVGMKQVPYVDDMRPLFL